MSATAKIKLLFFLLIISQQVYGVDRYFTWVNPQTKLRNRINADTYELFSEQEMGPWKFEGKINVDPKIFNRLPLSINNKSFIYDNGKRIRLILEGTGQVYDYYPLKKEIIRLDQTFHSGYNFSANLFSRKGVIHSAGGEGFWSFSTSITYFDEKLKEWEIIRPKNKGPQSITNGYQGYDKSLDVFYSGGSESKEFLEDIKHNYYDELYQFNFKNNSWELLGELNADLPFKKSKQIIWTGELFIHFADLKVYIINPLKNEVHIYKDNQKDLVWGYEHYVDNDTIVTFKGRNEGPILKISIPEIQKNATYFGKFYNSGIAWYWYYIGIFSVIIIMTILKWKPKEKFEGDELIFSPLEKKFLNKLLELKPNEYLNTFEINEILDSTDKSQENQRKIRFNIINQINKKLKAKYNWENAIERKPLPEDKRLTIYMLDPVVLTELKRLMR